MTSHVLHFSVGPVQGFIGEARRARDSWAGSFLLSWLSARAMLAVEAAAEEAGGDALAAIRFPDVRDDDLMAAVRRHAGAGRSAPAQARQRHPYIGSVPNRFKACVAPDFDPRDCRDALMSAWTELAEAVWEAFIAEAAEQGKGGRDATRAIWDRQVANFWDVAWVMGPEPEERTDGAWLDRRKNWRSHYPDVEEGGDHCQLMGFYQEISGFTRAAGESAAQDSFWRALQSAGDTKQGRASQRIGVLNLRNRERLCATALIKRLFPILSDSELERVIGWVPGGARAEKDNVNIRNWPSVSYVAAVPWLKEVWRLAEPEGEGTQNACQAYQAAIDDRMERPPRHDQGPYGETETRLLGLDKPFQHPFFKLDGHFFHVDAVRTMPLERFKGGDERTRTARREEAV